MNQSLFGLITITNKQQELVNAIKNPSSQILSFINLIDTIELNKPCTKQGRYPVHLVAMRKKPLYTDIMMYLLYKRGAETDLKDGKNNTPLTYAIKNNNQRLINLLFKLRVQNAFMQNEITNYNQEDQAEKYCEKYSSLKTSKKKRTRPKLSLNFKKLTL